MKKFKIEEYNRNFTLPTKIEEITVEDYMNFVQKTEDAEKYYPALQLASAFTGVTLDGIEDKGRKIQGWIEKYGNELLAGIVQLHTLTNKPELFNINLSLPNGKDVSLTFTKQDSWKVDGKTFVHDAFEMGKGTLKQRIAFQEVIKANPRTAYNMADVLAVCLGKYLYGKEWDSESNYESILHAVKGASIMQAYPIYVFFSNRQTGMKKRILIKLLFLALRLLSRAFRKRFKK